MIPLYRLSLVLCRNVDCDYSSAYVVNQAGGMALKVLGTSLANSTWGLLAWLLTFLSAPGTFFIQIHILASSSVDAERAFLGSCSPRIVESIYHFYYHPEHQPLPRPRAQIQSPSRW